MKFSFSSKNLSTLYTSALKLVVVLTLIVNFNFSFSQGNDPVVLGYFPSWSETWTSPGNNSTLREIPAYVNHVFLSFAKPNLTYVQGSYDISNTGIQTPYDGCTLKESVKVLSDKGIHVILSIGGETYWNSPNAYNIDYQQIKDLVDDIGFAGIDWDYEPNGSFSGIGTATNVQHFIDFITNSRAIMPSSAGYIIACAPSGVGALGGITNDDIGSPFAYANRNTLTGESDANLFNATVTTNGINMFGFSATGHMLPVFDSVGHDIDLVAFQGYNLGASTNRTLMYDAFAYYAELYGFKVAAGVHYPDEPWGPYYTYTHANVASLSTHINNDLTRTGDGDGIMIWQMLLTGSNSSAYSYLNVASDVLNGTTEVTAIANANNFLVQPYSGASTFSCFCTAPQPDLGINQSICGVTSLTLNSNVNLQTGVTFTWILDGDTVVTSSTTQNTYSVTQPGVYILAVEEGGCSNSDEIIITNSLPTFSLGSDLNICTSGSAVISTSFTDPSYTYIWTLNGNIITGATNTTYTATTPGIYDVTVSAAGCTSEQDDLTITDNLPTFDLGATVHLCVPAMTTINTGFTDPNYTYTWTLNGLIIPGITSTNYIATLAGDYIVTANSTGCSSTSDSLTITSSLPLVTNDTICQNGIINLSVNENVEWYDSQTGGTLVNSGMTYSPSITLNTTYWVTPPNSTQTYTTMRATFQGDGWQQNPNVYGTKIIVSQDITLDEITVDADGGTITLNIVEDDGVTVVATTTTSSISGLNIIPLGFTLTPGTYFLNTVGSTSNIYVDLTPSLNYDNTGVLTVEGNAYWDWGTPSGSNYVLSGDYGTFTNLNYTTGSNCDRVPVKGIIDVLNPICGCTGQISYSFITEIVCEQYTTPSGINITNSGIYTDTITNATNCDSIITIDLTVNSTTSSIHTENRCTPFLWIDGNTYDTSNTSATHTLTNVSGCDSIITLNLTINTISTSVTQSGSTLTADEIGVNYQWLNCPDMTLINNATNQSYTASSDGSFALIISHNSCLDTSACYTINGVGLLENDFGKELKLYPNPTVGSFSIDLGQTYKFTSIRITDLIGKTIQSQSFTNSQILNLNINESAGIYLLLIESTDKKAIIKLIKE